MGDLSLLPFGNKEETRESDEGRELWVQGDTKSCSQLNLKDLPMPCTMGVLHSAEGPYCVLLTVCCMCTRTRLEERKGFTQSRRALMGMKPCMD